MAVTRRRTRPAAAAAPAARRRDRTRPVEEEDDDLEVDATERPARTRTAAAKAKPPRRPIDDDLDEEEDEDDLDEEEEKEEEEEEDAEEEEEEDDDPPPRRKPAAKKAPEKKAASTRRARPEPADEEEEDEEDDDDEPAPRKRTAAKSKSSTRDGLSSVKSGWAGAEEVRKSGGGQVDRLVPSDEPSLVRFLEDAPFANYSQHWVPSGQGGDRPYLCVGADCPLCAIADRPNKQFCFNVLHINSGDEPATKLLRLGVRAYEALKAAGTDKTTDKIRINREFFSITVSGKKMRAQTNFRLVKRRDLQDDWDEIFEVFNYDDLDAIIAEGKEHLFAKNDVVQLTPRSELAKIAKHISDGGAGDDDD